MSASAQAQSLSLRQSHSQRRVRRDSSGSASGRVDSAYQVCDAGHPILGLDLGLD